MSINDLDSEGRCFSQSLIERYRRQMVSKHLSGRNISDLRVLRAMGLIERHKFIPDVKPAEAYGDFPVSIGWRQTISQPYMVALMTEALCLDGSETVLEIGTGSGYHTAILAQLSNLVYTIEVVPELAGSAETRLGEMGYKNVKFRLGNGRAGWPEHGPFDAIVVAAASVSLPKGLREQLGEGGRLVIPVGSNQYQELVLHTREKSGFSEESLGKVRFVPLV